MGQVGTAALSYLGYALEAVKGVPAASINDFLFITGNNIEATPDIIRKNVFAGSRSAERIVRPSKFKIQGTLTHPLYGNSGAQFIMAALGLDTYLAAVSATYTVGSTGTGLTTFTSSTAGLMPGAWVTFGSGATQDIRQILPTGTNHWAVAALSAANQGAAGAFDQIAQHKFSPIPSASSNPLPYTLPSLTLEMNEGGQWAWQLAGCHVGTYNIKGGKEDVEISENIIGTQMPVKLGPGSFTAFSPTTAELADVARPFTINDGFVIVPTDASGAGSSTLQPLLTLESWEVDYNNGMMDKAFWDGGQVYKVFPGLQKTSVKYAFAIQSGRPDAYEDYLSRLKAVPIPFTASMALNIGTPTTPVWYAYGTYVPSSVMTKASVGRSVTDVLTMNVEADALISNAADDIMSIFVANSSTSAYAGS